MLSSIQDIQHAFYINLDHRTDRKTHIEEQLYLVGINAQRFNAVKLDNGAIGCSMSHLKILQQAIKDGLPHVAIIEDDTLFLDPGLFVMQFNQFLKTHDTWDVVLMAGNNIPPFQVIDDTCVRVSHCQTTTAYIVNGHYMETLANNIKEGIQRLMREPEKHIMYAIDKYWLQLQKKGFWFLITPLTVVQKEDYSDIEKRVTNYNSLMTDLEKRHFKPNILRRVI